MHKSGMHRISRKNYTLSSNNQQIYMGSGMNTAKTKAHEMIAKEKKEVKNKKEEKNKKTKKRRRNTKESRLNYHL